MNTQLMNIHLVSSSNKVDCIQQSEPLVKDLILLEEKGLLVHDAFLNKKVLLIAPVLGVFADNPRASEVSNHLGVSALLYCRKCKVSYNYAISVNSK